MKKASLKNGKNLINDFKKFGDTGSNLDLMLYYVELGVRYTYEYGSMNQAFYDGLCRGYGEFIELFDNEGTKTIYKIIIDNYGGCMKFISLEKGLSTTQIINNILNSDGNR